MHFDKIFENFLDALAVIDAKSKKILYSNLEWKKMFSDQITLSFSFEQGHFDEKKLTTIHGDKKFDLTVTESEMGILTVLAKNIDGKQSITTPIQSLGHKLALLTKELDEKNKELKACYEVMIQSGKIMALAELSSGIAHELHQPLQCVLGFSEDLKFTLDQEGKSYEQLDEVLGGARRMRDIIKDLRSLIEKNQDGFRNTSLHECIEDCLRGLKSTLDLENIEIEYKKQDLPETFVNPGQLEQVLFNLLKNAIDAIKESGKEKKIIKIQTKQNLQTLEIVIEDNGVGLREEEKSKIFNPFYTTKAPNHGMGLGLSLTHRMMENFQGSIHVESNFGVGTKFKLILPAISNEEKKAS